MSLLNGGDSSAAGILVVVAGLPKPLWFDAVIPPHRDAAVQLETYVPFQGNPNDPPALEAFEFSDPGGTRYRQPEGGHPEAIADM